MTIRRGEDWGDIVTAPAELVTVSSDAALAARLDVGDPRPVHLTGGDLLASVGGSSKGPTMRRLPLDVLRVTTDTGACTSVAHVVARRSWWRGPVIVVANVDQLGQWDVAPRAHPNDGQADVVEVDPRMAARVRRQVWRRLPTGTHVPHPDIRTRRITDETWTFDRPLRVWVDGERRGTTRMLQVTVEPDAAVVYA